MDFIEKINQIVEPLNQWIVSTNDFLWGSILIVVLLGVGVYFTIRTKFVQVRYFKEMLRLLGDRGDKRNKKEKSISSFQAFCVSTAARVGIGNIVGVTIAIVMGGPGSVFWMWIVAIIGAASGFIESTLAQLYKEKAADGTYVGGPAYYMQKGLKSRWLGIIFAILITISFGLIFTAVQANTITMAVDTTFAFDRGTVGIILAAITGIVIFGGVTRIAKISEVMVPIMAVAYMAIAIFVIVTNLEAIPTVLGIIFQNAFGMEQIAGGTLGGVIALGVKRGLFSNEAGMGSAPNVAATAKVSHPVKQGLIQSLGVFTDTLLICSATAFMILLPVGGVIDPAGAEGITIVNNILVNELGTWAGVFLTICTTFFAFSTIVGCYYYGETNVEFLSKKRVYMTGYRLVVVGMVLFGAVAELAVVWNLADLFMGLMALVNLIAIVLLGKYAFKLLKDYDDQKKAGIIDPVFTIASMPELENVTEWDSYGDDDDDDFQPNTQVTYRPTNLAAAE
ncbi:MAG: alanine/glycine:cation symporter family protein [Culicoidibacterales bacterium]